MVRQKTLAIICFTLPTLAFYIYFFLTPVFDTVYNSLFEWDGISDKLFLFLGNYLELLQDPIFYKALGNTFYWVLLVIILQIPLGFFLAYFIYQKVKAFKLLRTVYFIPVIASAVAVSLAFSFIYEAQFGILNSFLKLIGLEQYTTAWLQDPNTAMTAVSLPFVWNYVGLMMVVLYSGLQSVPDELIEASEIDGVNALQKIWYVILPSLRNVLVICLVLGISYAFKQFDYVLLLTNGGPVHLTEVTGTYMYKQGFSEARYGYGNAIAITMMFIVIVFTLIINKVLQPKD
ncbi:carbohydrate ABC transporter permease [Gracilibacillus alcaliphilus]|uniref:carbohydrate ABC transporter permease n=1 Tax=Gracilibacillus alcaliphilus TaxID=1401441 RepID=UPI00195B9146|nr:sugar ABC transporter permease [Gracilibacillus alcaliphilus]MBM7676416.1 raffinose/stachyose/melibiose transport system permease protein [Gracilibacillus alcaliphilus]